MGRETRTVGLTEAFAHGYKWAWKWRSLLTCLVGQVTQCTGEKAYSFVPGGEFLTWIEERI